MSRVTANDRAGDGRNEDRAPGNGAKHDALHEHASQDEDQSSEKKNEPQKPPVYKRPVFWIVIGAIALIGLIVFLLWLFIWRYHVTTDDAFITAHSTTVSPRVSGHVEKVLVDDNQDVKRGDPLLVLDQRDFIQAVKSSQAFLESAKAQLAQADAQVASSNAAVAQAKAEVASAQASANQAQADQERYHNVQKLDPRAVSQQQVDQADANARTTTAQLESTRQKLGAAEAQVKVAEAQIVAANAMIDKAKSDVENAQLQLSYTTVYAAEDGQVTNRSVEAGNYVQPGQALMAVVPRDVYVIANYKETQLKTVRLKQNVKIHIDAYDIDLSGHVESIQSGTGAAFSLLPPENATGNYVKVVQRIPVKIVFDELPPQRLSPGMSVEPKIYTK